MYETVDSRCVGYVPRASGKHTVLFNTGFFVQEDKDPKKCGWYRYKHPHQVGANVGAGLYTGLAMVAQSIQLLEPVYGAISEECTKVDALNAKGQFPAPAKDSRFVVFDTPDVHYIEECTIYAFPTRRFLFGDPLAKVPAKNFDIVPAIGLFNTSGDPFYHADIAPKSGIVTFV